MNMEGGLEVFIRSVSTVSAKCEQDPPVFGNRQYFQAEKRLMEGITCKEANGKCGVTCKGITELMMVPLWTLDRSHCSAGVRDDAGVGAHDYPKAAAITSTTVRVTFPHAFCTLPVPSPDMKTFQGM